MPEAPLPPYTYTPGVTPHPVSDPEGHSYGRGAVAVTLGSSPLSESPAFRRGVRLFREGYYWEAHEEWESLWHALGRRGAGADLLKGLIKLAAAGVKAREGNAEGIQRHGRRAVELLTSAAASDDQMVDRETLSEIIRLASHVTMSTTTYHRLDHGQPVVFWPDLAGALDRL